MVQTLLRAWLRVADLTERDGRENRRRIFANAVRVWRGCHVPDLDAVRSSGEFDELLWRRLTEQQRQQLDAGRERIRRLVPSASR